MLVGRVRRGGAEVLRLAAGRNVHPQPRDRFELAPDDFLAAERAARADGLEVVGFWHSHPATGAVPSAVDRGAAWEGYSYLIVSLVGREQLRSWRFAGGEPVEQLIVEPAGAKGLRP